MRRWIWLCFAPVAQSVPQPLLGALTVLCSGRVSHTALSHTSFELIQEMRNSIWGDRHGTLCVGCHMEAGAAMGRRDLQVGIFHSTHCVSPWDLSGWALLGTSQPAAWWLCSLCSCCDWRGGVRTYFSLVIGIFLPCKCVWFKVRHEFLTRL